MSNKKHTSKILDFAQKLGSREAGFVFACLGVLSQTIHTWFITVQLSSLTGFLQFMQAGIMSLFLNGALLYFTLKGTEHQELKKAKRYRNLVVSFASLEVGINLYYWAYKFMIVSWPEVNWGRMIIAIPFAIVLPIVLAAYSFEVRVDDYSDIDEDNSLSDTDKNTLTESIKSELTTKISEQIKAELQEKHSNELKLLEEKYNNRIGSLVKEQIPSSDQLIVKGLLSDQERVDLEFEWKDKDGNILTRVLPNVKLKKIETNEVLANQEQNEENGIQTIETLDEDSEKLHKQNMSDADKKLLEDM